MILGYKDPEPVQMKQQFRHIIGLYLLMENTME
jgi:hypothetical protein